jgi:hypothetical protein
VYPLERPAIRSVVNDHLRQGANMSMELSRRNVLKIGAATGVGAALAATAMPGVAAAAPPQSRRAVSMAMHIHSTFSEGTASMDAHLQQAAALGVDVIWWTDHDFRMQGIGYRNAVRFEGLSEPENGLDWDWKKFVEGTLKSQATSFVAEPHSPDEPGKAMRLAATATSASWGGLLYEGTAWNSTYTRSLAATLLEIDVLAESVGPNAELIVRILSSYRPATAGRPAGRYTLEYRIGQQAGRSTENQGLVGVVGIVAQPGQWQRVTLDLGADVAALWPDIVAADSAIYRLRVGARSRNGAAVSGVFDRLRFNRGRIEGNAAVFLQDEMMREYAARYPNIVQFHGTEISLVRHLNSFGGNFTLPDYGTAGPQKVKSVAKAIEMVDFVHAHNGLVTFNHPLEDAPSGPELAELLITTRSLGADMVEVGSKEDFGESVFGYDAAARNAVFVTATGTSDDHGGADWVGQKQRWVTSVWADSTSEADLFASLRAGRAWFWDPQFWRGEMDLSVQGAVPMGGVVVTPALNTPVQIAISDVPPDALVVLVVGEVDYAGVADASPATSSQSVALNPQGKATVVVPTGTSRYVRLELRNAAGAVIGFSNPVWILKEEPAHPIPADRLR